MSKKRVLVVADDPAEVWAVGSTMLKNGFAVTATTSGADGFHQLERNTFDYLVLDIGIGEIGSFNFLGYCHRYFPGTKVIAVADSNLSPVQEIAFAGVCGRLPRPVDPEVLCNLVSHIDAHGKAGAVQ